MLRSSLWGVALVLAARRCSKACELPLTSERPEEKRSTNPTSLNDTATEQPLPSERPEGSDWQRMRAVAAAVMNACGVGSIAAVFAYSFLGAAQTVGGLVFRIWSVGVQR